MVNRFITERSTGHLVDIKDIDPVKWDNKDYVVHIRRSLEDDPIYVDTYYFGQEVVGRNSIGKYLDFAWIEEEVLTHSYARLLREHFKYHLIPEELWSTAKLVMRIHPSEEFEKLYNRLLGNMGKN